MTTHQLIPAKPIVTASPSFTPVRSGLLQRKCACGGTPRPMGDCKECAKKKLSRQRKEDNHNASRAIASPLGLPVLQRKLAIGASSDPLEREADRVADQVLAASAHTGVSGALPQIQRFAAQPTGHSDAAPASVDRALASSGSPLEPAVRQDMEERFGHDFSRVRVNSDSVAQQSARDVRAHAYTVGHNIVFGAGEFQPGTRDGRRLLAHELTHVVQQTQSSPPLGVRRLEQPSDSREPSIRESLAPIQVARRPRRGGTSGTITVSHVVIYLPYSFVDFHTSAGVYRYHLDHTGLVAGEYNATAVVTANNVDFTLDGHIGNFEFSYRLDTGKPNPSTFFANQSSVLINITNDEAPPSRSPDDPRPQELDPNVTYLSPEEAMRRCEAGDLAGIKVFPYRGTRFGAAPIMAHRDGNDIVVKQPVYVLGNDDFRAQTRTLPTATFIGGVRLLPNEIVRLHTYEPRWYHLNVTGSTSGDIEDEFCVTAEQMLEIAEGSTNRTMLNIGLTVVDGALFFVPVGRIAAFLGRPVMHVAGRSSRNLAVAIMLGMREASPTAFAGIASRTGTVIVEQQAVSQVGGRAVAHTAGYATVEFSERAIAQTATAAAAEGVADIGGQQLARQAVARTVTVTVVDAAGSTSASTLTTPTGDAAVDAAIDQAFSQTFDMTATPSVGQAGQGVVSVAPEIAAGFTQAQVQGFRRFINRRFSDADIQVLEQLWDDAARAGDDATLNAANSRGLFNLHRDRFWRVVRNDDTARALFENAGCEFSGGAPFFTLNGRRITMTIDHIIERQTSPQLALTASNLRISFSRENSVVLRLINHLDPFQ